MTAKQLKKAFICIAFSLLLLAVWLIGGQVKLSASADTALYTSVLTD